MLGRLGLYQLSYSRKIVSILVPNAPVVKMGYPHQISIPRSLVSRHDMQRVHNFDVTKSQLVQENRLP